MREDLKRAGNPSFARASAGKRVLCGLPVVMAAGLALGQRIPLETRRVQATATNHVEFTALAPTSSWLSAESIAFDVVLPEDGPTDAQVLVYVKDWDNLWYQKLEKGFLVPGGRNHFRVRLLNNGQPWEPRGHHGTWHYRALLAPHDVGIRVFWKQAWQGTCSLSNTWAAVRRADKSPPFIRNVRRNAGVVPCFEKFEVSFAVPDRYANPFDTSEVEVGAEFETPGGNTVHVDAFYGRDYYRRVDEAGERLVPQAAPYWRVRFAPHVPGQYRYRLTIRDRHGKAEWGPGVFEARPGKRPGFIRVSKKDFRYFEHDDGTLFFPLGHNTRSPFDTRMDKQFPWRQRRPKGTAVYGRYFRKMAENGENMAEVWMAAWSLGLEWVPRWRGYHGIGQYNMMHAWELDRVIEEAERNKLYLNLVIHNHGKFSAWCDEEWAHNPFNAKNGGYLHSPDDYFTDPRALRSFRRLMRYTIARWGHSTSVMAWALWSELDLVGAKQKPPVYKTQAVVDWHSLMGRALKEMDPYDHMVTTHVCGDYTHQNPDINALPEIDFSAVDAYHNSANPVYIVDLMRRTAVHNAVFKKPVLITEFGGSPFGQDVRHLEQSLHAGIWGGLAVPVGGPMLWWWQLIDEENLYPVFAAARRFIQGEDVRDPEAEICTPRLAREKSPASDLGIQCLRGPNWALGWIYRSKDFHRVDPRGTDRHTNVVMNISGLSNATYRAEFWDTIAGVPIETREVTKDKSAVDVPVPGFARDIAFKLKALDGR